MQIDFIKIAIVDDHKLFRSGVARLMAEFPQIEVVFEADDGTMMMELINSGNLPQVILMDINMQPMDGYQTTLWLNQYYPSINILALSMYEDEKAILKMIKAGAGGYLLKGAMPNELLNAIIGIAEKRFYMNDLVTGRMIRSLQSPVITKELSLTVKETEFLKLCATELTYREIAEVLKISPRTADSYREILFVKLSLKSRVGLALFAVKNELVKL